MSQIVVGYICLFIVFFVDQIQPSYAQSSASDDVRSNAESVYDSVNHSIFLVKSFEMGSKESFQGSAVAVDKNILATNCHVALAGNILVVYLPNKKATGFLFYNKGDLCLITVADAQFTPVKIRPSNSVKIGEEVYAVGNPEGFEKSISNGIISNKYESDGIAVLQTTAAISPGSSGGGLFDKNGSLIGITFLKNEEVGAEGLGFAIPTELILEAISPDAQLSIQPKISNSSEQLLPDKSPENSNISIPMLIGHYGNSNIGLYRWNSRCFITLRGEYRPNEVTSLAVWFPANSNGFFVFPAITKIKDVVSVFNKIYSNGDPSYVKSKNYLLLDNQLFDLSSVLNSRTIFPVLVFAVNKDLTEKLIVDDYFLIQLYQYRGQSGMTTIKFNLDGFTEALSAYNNSCDK